MGLPAGYGILGLICNQNESTQIKLGYLKKFADLGFVEKFYEVVDDDVYEILNDGDQSTIEKLSETKLKKKILSAWKKGHITISFEVGEQLEPFDIYLPAPEITWSEIFKKYKRKVKIPGNEEKKTAGDLDDLSVDIESIIDDKEYSDSKNLSELRELERIILTAIKLNFIFTISE